MTLGQLYPWACSETARNADLNRVAHVPHKFRHPCQLRRNPGHCEVVRVIPTIKIAQVVERADILGCTGNEDLRKGLTERRKGEGGFAVDRVYRVYLPKVKTAEGLISVDKSLGEHFFPICPRVPERQTHPVAGNPFPPTPPSGSRMNTIWICGISASVLTSTD